MKTEWWKLARRGAVVAIVACCVVGLTGCGGDDDDADVVGTWEIGPDSGTDEDGSRETFVFNADGSFDQPDNDNFISGTYTISGNSIKMTLKSEDSDPGEDTIYTTTITGKVDGNSMSGTWSDDEGDGTWSGTRI